MISDETLLALVPPFLPPPLELPGGLEGDREMSEAARRVSAWASVLRVHLRRMIGENPGLDRLVETSGFVGTGVFRVSGRDQSPRHPGFPVVDGYQFGAVLLRARLDPEFSSLEIPLGDLPLRPPLVQFAAHTELHADLPDGRIAAYFEDDDGTRCAITARHVVEYRAIGQRVPVLCGLCGRPTRLRRRAPGWIDAAAVEAVCPLGDGAGMSGDRVHSVSDGDAVRLHLGGASPQRSTVVMGVQLGSEIRTAAVPKHFLTDKHGYPGDSGSLVSGDSDRALCGIYLGKTNCEDGRGWSTPYGFALDLRQAADILGVTSKLSGAFHG